MRVAPELSIVALIASTAEALDWIKKYFMADLPVQSSFTRKERMAENDRVLSSSSLHSRIQEEAVKHSREESVISTVNAKSIILFTYDWCFFVGCCFL